MNRIFKLSGLTCPACKKIIEKRVYALPGITGAIVDLKLQEVTVDAIRNINILEIKEALADTQYQVIK